MTTQQRYLPETDAAAPGVPRYVTIAGRCYGLSGVSSVLHQDAAAVLDDVSHRRLLAIGDEQDQLLFPVWQFPHGRRLPHLIAVLDALARPRRDSLATALWFTRPRRELDGACAAGWLQRGDPDRVLALIAASRQSLTPPDPRSSEAGDASPALLPHA
jgi:hypothetical protein